MNINKKRNGESPIPHTQNAHPKPGLMLLVYMQSCATDAFQETRRHTGHSTDWHRSINTKYIHTYMSKCIRHNATLKKNHMADFDNVVRFIEMTKNKTLPFHIYIPLQAPHPHKCNNE